MLHAQSVPQRTIAISIDSFWWIARLFLPGHKLRLANLCREYKCGLHITTSFQDRNGVHEVPSYHIVSLEHGVVICDAEHCKYFPNTQGNNLTQTMNGQEIFFVCMTDIQLAEFTTPCDFTTQLQAELCEKLSTLTKNIPIVLHLPTFFSPKELASVVEWFNTNS
jgi:hypothetical protein